MNSKNIDINGNIQDKNEEIKQAQIAEARHRIDLYRKDLKQTVTEEEVFYLYITQHIVNKTEDLFCRF